MPTIGHRELRKFASLVRSLQGLVDQLENRKIALTPAQAERIERFRREGRCLVCENPLVEGEEIRRGSHASCYNRISLAIQKGTITEQAAVDAGDWNPTPEPPGRKPKYGRQVRAAVAEMAKTADRDKRRDKKPAKAKESR